MQNKRTSARVIGVDHNNDTVALMPYSQGVSISPVAPIVIPLSAFKGRTPIVDGAVVFEFVGDKYSILSIGEQT